MKCTDFHAKAGEMTRILHEELAQAIRLHGGEYVFYDPEDPEEEFDPLELPVIRATVANFQEEKYCVVSKVKMGDRYPNEVIVYGYPETYEGEYSDDEYILDLLDAGGRQIIIEAMPTANGIDDVSTNFEPFPVLSVNKESIKDAGYETEGMDIKTFRRIGVMVRNELPLGDYWKTLRYACDYYKVPKKRQQ